jgi:DNA-binding NarL/FixJ family response regulator
MNTLTDARISRAQVSVLIREVHTRPTRKLLLIGEPGIGKSTLVDAASAQFSTAGTVVLRASPTFAERYTAYSMLWDLLSGIDWSSLSELPGEHRAIVEIALGHQRAASELPSLATAVALEAILTELASRAHVVLVIDDLQWSDPESLATVERAFRRVPARGVSLVATSREYGTKSSNAPDFTFDFADVYSLDGLSVDELESLTRPAWPSTLTRAQVVALREHTGGNPMWARELIERGVIGNLGALPVGTLHAPLPLTVAVADRLSTLTPAAAEVVSVVALLGRPTLPLLTTVLRFSDVPITAIDEAEAAGFLALTTETARTRHPLHASAAAARLTPARRRALHAFIARAEQDPVVQAQHLQQSEPPGPNETIAEALTVAAITMRQRGARLRSAHFDAQAVERTDPATPHFQARLLNQAQQLFSAGDYAACVRTLALLSVPQLSVPQYDVYLALSTSCVSLSTSRRGAEDFLRTQAPAAHDQTHSAILSSNLVATTTMTVSERAQASEIAFVALAGIDAPNAVHRALRGSIRSQLEAGRGLDQTKITDLNRRQGIQIVVGLDDTGLATTADLAHQIDQLEMSRTAFAGLVEWARREGKEGIERTFFAHAAMVELIGDNNTAARDFAKRSELSVTSPLLPPALQYIAGLLMIAEGQHSDLDRMVEVWRSTAIGGLNATLALSALLGLSAVAQQDWHAAATRLRTAAQAADGLELVELGSRLRVDLPLIEALLHTGATEEAASRLSTVQSFLSTHDRPLSQIALHRISSIHQASLGDLTGALTEATSAVALSVDHRRPSDEARSRVQRARVLRRLRRVSLARADLDAAKQRAIESGNADLVGQVDTMLSTARKSRSATVLTPAESGVLALVRDGHSNRAVAAQLFVSVRTVESHVAAILRKTGETSRAKLISRG